MLELALKSVVPIITCKTTDTVNAPDIIAALAHKDVEEIIDFDCDQLQDVKADVIVINPTGELSGNFEELYATMVELEKTLVFVNTEYESPLFLDCGSIPVPPEMIQSVLVDVVSESEVVPIMSTLGGLDLKTIGEVIRITATRDGAVTVKGVINTRKMVVPPITGLTQIATGMAFYIPDAHLGEWLEKNTKYITADVDPRLRPRGLMFTGRAGCGKTQGAKYIAEAIGLPLYLLDLAGLLTRWHGESENNLRQALQTIDQESPCVVLMDEIEKVFASAEEGTTNRLLGTLLWWMQERVSKVLVVMTCNDIAKVPVELYREGRVDATLDFQGISTKTDAANFINHMVKTFEGMKAPTKKEVTTMVNTHWDPNGVSHALLAQIAIELIKNKNEV